MRCSVPITATRTLVFPAILLAPLLAQPAEFDPAVFQSPPAQYRGHAMWSFPLSTLNNGR